MRYNTSRASFIRIDASQKFRLLDTSIMPINSHCPIATRPRRKEIMLGSSTSVLYLHCNVIVHIFLCNSTIHHSHSLTAPIPPSAHQTPQLSAHGLEISFKAIPHTLRTSTSDRLCSWQADLMLVLLSLLYFRASVYETADEAYANGADACDGAGRVEEYETG